MNRFNIPRSTCNSLKFFCESKQTSIHDFKTYVQYSITTQGVENFEKKYCFMFYCDFFSTINYLYVLKLALTCLIVKVLLLRKKIFDKLV